MKLYATITSERQGQTSKKGGNEFLEIKLYRRNYMLGIVTLDNDTLTYQSTKTPKILDYLEETKSKKQKGKIDNVENYKKILNDW